MPGIHHVTAITGDAARNLNFSILDETNVTGGDVSCRGRANAGEGSIDSSSDPKADIKSPIFSVVLDGPMRSSRPASRNSAHLAFTSISFVSVRQAK